MNKTPVVLLILDGWGIAPKNPGNAIELAHKPHFDALWKKYPHTKLQAHGRHVGLPRHQVGNSEAGHMNIGAGRVIEQDATIISEEIQNGKFFKNVALHEVFSHCQKNSSDLHLFGMIADGDSPHSSLDHLYALVDMAANHGRKSIYLHLITDGRDSPQYAALKILDQVSKRINGKAVIATLIGRFFAMDRGKNWSRTKKAYDVLTIGNGTCFSNYKDAVLHAYNQGITDEFIEPSIICSNRKQLKHSRVKDNDAMVFFNLRSDRARQLTKCFVQKEFNALNPKSFKRRKVLENFLFCAFTDFGPDLDHTLTAFPSADIKHTLPMTLKDLHQVYIAETEKYAHMTYFINGGYDQPVNGEERIRIPSLKIKSYDIQPEMSVYKITSKTEKLIRSEKYDFIAINFANPDMVGHTGNLPAVIKAVEHVDVCIGKLANLILKKKGILIVTADHGNAERKLDLETGEVCTGHSLNPVPFILVSDKHRDVSLSEGDLASIAPTIYELIGMKPRDHFAHSLINK